MCKIASSNKQLFYLAMLDAGAGETDMNTIMTAMNMPAVNDKILKRHERIVGTAIEKLADKTCLDAVRQEKEFTLENLKKK